MGDEQRAWLQSRGVPTILDGLVARLLDVRPDNVVDFMIAELQEVSTQSPAAQACIAKMRADKVNEASIRAFMLAHKQVAQGATGTIAESDIEPASGLPSFASLPKTVDDRLLKQTVVLKLNGGLGTGMGLSVAKSLLNVKMGDTFLDFIAKQTLFMRQQLKANVRFMLMDSFSTSADTEAFLSSKYPESFGGQLFKQEVEVMQGKVPKISQATLLPASFPKDTEHEWVPPGHGELYIALSSSGKLDELLAAGFKYMFVSNSDNLGATLDLGILNYIDAQGLDFVMEVCERTESDKKGGHLARSAAGGGLLLRESSQCRKEDEAQFQDITKHRYFNTNNLWVNLESLKRKLNENQGILVLPVIRNGKTVDPTDAASEKVWQLETAMGTAISLFERVSAVVVPRSRFAPVKTCGDLLSLRSDCYQVSADFRLELLAERAGVPPVVALDDKYYKFVTGFETLVELAVPSMRRCDKVTVVGPIRFLPGTSLVGTVRIVNASETRKDLPPGEYTGEVNL